MEYLINNHKFSISYQELKEEHYKFCNMLDDDFRANLPAALHLACVISWFKELPTSCVLCDCGVIHELIHLLHGNNPISDFHAVRKQFEEILKLD